MHPRVVFIWLLMNQWPALEEWSEWSLLFWSHCAHQGHLVATCCFFKKAISNFVLAGEEEAVLLALAFVLCYTLCPLVFVQQAQVGRAALAPPGVQLPG